MTEKKKRTPRKPAEDNTQDVAQILKTLEALKAAGLLDKLLEAPAEVEEEEALVEEPEVVVEEPVVEPVAEAPVAPAAPELEPGHVALSVPDFTVGYFIGRRKDNGLLFTTAFGDIDLITLSGLLAYAQKFNDKLWQRFMPD